VLGLGPLSRCFFPLGVGLNPEGQALGCVHGKVHRDQHQNDHDQQQNVRKSAASRGTNGE